MILPDYEGGGIVNLMRSLGEACGMTAPLPYAPLREAKVSLRATARHIILLVIDGLGHDYLQRHGRGGHLQRHLRTCLTSVFPATTASAITTYLTGLAPQQHALTGWYMYFSELEAIAAVLPLRPRGADGFAAPPETLPARLFGHTPFSARLGRRCRIVSPQDISDSAFNRYHGRGAELCGYRSLEELFAVLAAGIAGTAEPSYVYAYYAELDALAHRHGIASPQAAACLARLDEAFGAFLATIAGSDTLVVVSADHGFIDSPPPHRLELERYPELAATLTRPLCGEHRVAYCYLRPGEERRFVDLARHHFGHCADLYPSGELIARGWFGPGAADPRLADRVGDYTLVMRDDWTLRDRVAGEPPHGQIGVHGGLSADEMLVPLIVVDAAQ